jgi:hypothetical protein
MSQGIDSLADDRGKNTLLVEPEIVSLYRVTMMSHR